MGVNDNSSSGGKDKVKDVATTKEGPSMLFQVSMLNSTNYTVWAIHMKVIFNVHQVGMSLTQVRLIQRKTISIYKSCFSQYQKISYYM